MKTFSPALRLGFSLLISGFGVFPYFACVAQAQGNAALIGGSARSGSASSKLAACNGRIGVYSFSFSTTAKLSSPCNSATPRLWRTGYQALLEALWLHSSHKGPVSFKGLFRKARESCCPCLAQAYLKIPWLIQPRLQHLRLQNMCLALATKFGFKCGATLTLQASKLWTEAVKLICPKIGAINLGGVQVKDLEAVLKKQVSTVFNNVNVSASLGKLRGITVYVVGQANQPGTYNLNSLSTLVNALFASGGPNNNGSMRQIELKRGGKTVTTLDLYDFIGKGDKSKDAALQPGDIIMIPPAGPRMALVGATDHGAIYELKPGSKVKDVLALGGGLSALASQQKALLERINLQTSQTVQLRKQHNHPKRNKPHAKCKTSH
jgi:protein involved in polysaccharide export with SLBB domain